jgi:hypothetical protein
MAGMHRTVRPGKPVFFENLRIEASEVGVVYIAFPGGGHDPLPPGRGLPKDGELGL